MDKQVSQSRKRPRVLTLCMLAATVSTLALAGCGNGEDEMPPAQQPDTMEQDATTTTAPTTPGCGLACSPKCKRQFLPMGSAEARHPRPKPWCPFAFVVVLKRDRPFMPWAT